jgi:hypothetical protein
MAEPTRKSFEVENLLTSILGVSRTETIKADKCVFCKQDADEFRDELSRREYRISGICQKCQDNVFGV